MSALTVMQPIALIRFREKFKIFTLLIVLFGFFTECSLQKCASPNISNSEFEYGYTFKEALSLNFSGVIESFPMTGTERIFDTSNNNWPVNYIDARYGRGVLEVYTTPNFKKYVEEQSSSRINLAVTLVCEDQSRPILVFRITIKRENLYEPTFTKPFYDLTIPLPLYKGFDLTSFEQISARDIDIFDNKVTFSSNYTGIVDVKTKSGTSEDGKTFYAMLLLTAPLVSLPQPLEFFITAMDSGQPARYSSAKVRLSADEEITFIHPPKFEKSLYVGELNDTLALNVEAPVLTFETWTADVKFLKEGNDANLFTLTPSNNRVLIMLSRPLTDTDVEDRSFLSFVLIATRPDDMTGSCSVVIEIPQKTTGFLPVPSFEKATYKGKLEKDSRLILEDVVLRNRTYSDGIVFKLDGDLADYFDKNITRNIISFATKQPIPEFILKNQKYLNFVLFATSTDGDSSSTSIVLDMPTYVTPDFTKMFYKGTLDRYYQLNLEEISLKVDSFDSGITVTLVGNDAKFFNAKLNSLNVVLEINDQTLNPDELIRRTSLDFTVIAENSDGLNGKTTVSVELPANCGSGNSTCPPCIAPTSETCIQPTTADPSSSPIFDRKLYLYRIQPFYLGVIGVLSANIPGSSDNVLYSVDISNDHLKSRLSLQQSTGQIAVNEFVSPGLYTFQAVATNPISGAKGYARVRLAVDTAMTCPNGTTVVSSTLIVKHIAEEKVHMDLLNARYGRCLLTIFSMDPSDQGYVTIDNRTSQLTSIAIDREDNIFEAMLIPQITVQLKLNCPNAANIRNRRALPSEFFSTDDSKSLILTDDIPFNPLLTTLTLIIEDINDNSPEFVFPPKNGYVVGYPEVDVYYKLMPEYLLKVEATDRDTGLNAKIRYSLVENDFFEIDPESGIIYPLAKSSKPFKNIELTVVAKDRDGAPNGRSTKIVINVKLLVSSSVTLLILNDQYARNLETVLKNVSQSIQGDVYSLRHAMLPGHTIKEEEEEQYARAENTAVNKVEKQTMLRVWIYVIDAQGNFVDGSDVERKLENLRDKFNFETSPYETASENEALSVDAVGLIAGISVLGVLLLATIAGAVIFWWIWLRPYNFKSISNETTSETISSEGSLENDVKYKAGNSYYYEEGESFDPNNYKKRASMPISGVTHVDTSDESNTNSLEGGYSNNSDNSDGSRGQNERRKSIVTFNELVERIDIEVNDNNFRHHGSSMDDDERL